MPTRPHTRLDRGPTCVWLASRTLRVLALLAAVVTFAGAGSSIATAASRIKDIADFEGVRDNLLVGYGLVVGLNGTGDTLTNAPFTRQSLVAMLERLSVNTRGTNLKTENVAAVMVAADLPSFTRQGTRIDVTVSSLGDSDSLLGGTLLVTPLMGADGEFYAVAQGNLVVGGFSAKGAAESIVKGVPTSARISSGAIVEREINFKLKNLDSILLSLRNPDLTTARRISQAINAFVGAPVAHLLDPATVELKAMKGEERDMVALITDIEQLRVETDTPARVVIDEQSSVIIMGQEVRVDTVAMAQGNLTIRVTETPQVSQPQPFAQTGETVTVPRTQIEVDEGADRKLTVVERGVRLQDLVDGLNSLGVGPRDLISILQAIKAAAKVLSVGDAGDEGARGEALIVRPRELVQLALDHLHPSAAESMVDSDRFPAWKHNLNWRVGSEGLVQRWFSMHPLVVVPTRKSRVEVNEQIDGSYFFTVVPDFEHVHVVTDSDEVCVSCVAPADYYYARPQGANRFSVATLAEVLRALKAKLFRHYPTIDYFARHAVRFHAGPLTSDWSAVIEESENVVAAVLDHYGGLPPADPSAVHCLPGLPTRQPLAVPVL